MTALPYKFISPLVEGKIIRRVNRFIMEVWYQQKVVLCHCPCTGRIGGLVLQDLPCLLSEHTTSDGKRKTHYTVEAISLNALTDDIKYWIGINQNAANRYIEYFLQTNQLAQIVNCQHSVLREQVFGRAKLDFLVEDIYLEVKTPLIILPLPSHYCTNSALAIHKTTQGISFERFVRHMDELSISLSTHQRAILILFYMFVAEPFIPPITDKTNTKIVQAVLQARQQGVEMWQVNARFTPEMISLVDYYPLRFQ